MFEENDVKCDMQTMQIDEKENQKKTKWES